MKSKIVLGLFLIIIGVMVALTTTNVLPFESYFFKIAIAGLIGLYGLYQLFFKRHIFWGGLVISLFAIFILNYYFANAWDFLVPAILVFLGLEFILGKTGVVKSKEYKMNSENMDADTIDTSNFLSGSGKKVLSQQFKGGSVSTILGGAEIDLTRATLAPEGAVIDVNAVLGGIEFKLPSHMRIQNDVSAILGGTDVEGNMASDATGPILTVRGSAILGGINFKY